MDISLIQISLQGIKAASDIIKNISEINNTAEMNAKVIELQNILLSLQRQIILSEEQRSDLLKLARLHEEERMKVKKFASEKKRYALTGVMNGLCLVYALKESMKRTDPPHWICTRCYENGKRSILNQKRDSGDRISLQCTECFSDIHSDSSEFELPKYV